jgi:hypothetical protein
MLLLGEKEVVHLDMIMTHHAEDVIDRVSPRRTHYFAQQSDMVQIPVPALPPRCWS